MPIPAVSGALRDLAARACTGVLQDEAVLVRQPAEVPYLQGDGVAVILLRADADSLARNQPSHGGVGGIILPLDQRYALVPYAMEALEQHRLLALLIRAVVEQPVLSAADQAAPVTVGIDTPDAATPDPTAGWPACLRLRVRGVVIAG